MRVKNQIDTFAVSNYNSAINQNDTQKDGGTFVISILEEAMTHIDELEIENEELRAEIERLKARNLGGRKRHNAAWMASYQEFAITIYQTKEEIESDWMETCKLINKHSTSDLQPIEEYRIVFSSNGRSVSLRSNKYNGYPSALIFIKEIDNGTRLRYGYIELHLGMKKGTDKLIPLMI